MSQEIRSENVEVKYAKYFMRAVEAFESFTDVELQMRISRPGM